MTNQMDNQTVQKDYENALRQATWHKLRSWLGRSCNDLLSVAEIFKHLQLTKQHQLGLQIVPLAKIVGSSRAHDFDLAFYPLRREEDGRWLNIAQARYTATRLPPPLLYKVGEAYLVEDGNHRISVARLQRQETIEARVIEIDAASLTPDHRCTRLGYKLPHKEKD